MEKVSARDQLMSVLFGGTEALVNIKFLTAGCGKVLEEDLCLSALAAIHQRRDGSACVSERFPDSGHQVDVRALIASL